MLTQTLQELQCLLRGGLYILHVVQYLYPNGPPIGIHPPLGIESTGGKAWIGLEFGGNIPGSVVAHIHSEM